MDLKARAKKLKIDIPAIFLALKDKDTPFMAKLFAGITVAYALSPVDLVPDFIPVLGYLDRRKCENWWKMEGKYKGIEIRRENSIQNFLQKK